MLRELVLRHRYFVITEAPYRIRHRVRPLFELTLDDSARMMRREAANQRDLIGGLVEWMSNVPFHMEELHGAT